MFWRSSYLALGFLTNYKHISQNYEVSRSEIENKHLSLAPGVGMEKIIVQLGVYWVHLASMNTTGSKDLQKWGRG